MMPRLAVISFLNALVFLKLQVCKNLFAIEHDEQTRREIYRKCLDGNGFSHLDDGEATTSLFLFLFSFLNRIDIHVPGGLS